MRILLLISLLLISLTALNAQAPQRLVKTIEYLLSTQKAEKIKKGYQIGVVGFFIMLFLIIMIIVLVALLMGDSSMI